MGSALQTTTTFITQWELVACDLGNLIESGFAFVRVSRAKEREGHNVVQVRQERFVRLHMFLPLSGKTLNTRPLHQILWRDLVRVVKSGADVWKVNQLEGLA